MPDANLEQAAEVTLSGAMKYSGQKCTATSRAIVSKEVKKEFTEILLNKFENLKVGDGMDSENVVVPVIDNRSLSNISEKIKAGIDEGSRLIFGGEVIKDGDFKKGIPYFWFSIILPAPWLAPSILTTNSLLPIST